MCIERVPNRNSPPAVLLRESYREGSQIRKRTLANLSKLPDSVIENLRVVLKGGAAIENVSDSFSVERSLPHGHVAIVKNKFKSNGLGANLTFEKLTQPTPLQQKALDLLEVSLICTQ